MLTLIMNIEGKTYSDLRYAIDEVKKAIDNEYRGGSNDNEDGNYNFDITGEEEEETIEE